MPPKLIGVGSFFYKQQQEKLGGEMGFGRLREVERFRGAVVRQTVGGWDAIPHRRAAARLQRFYAR